MTEHHRVALLGELGHRDSAVSLGGTGVGLVRLATGLQADGWAVTVVTARARRLDGYGERLPEDTRTADLGEGGRLSQLWRLIRYLRRNRPHILVARDSRAIDLALTAKAWLRAPPVLVCALHNQANVRPDPRTGAERRKQRRFQAMARRADAVLAVSPGLLAAARERLGPGFARAQHIPNPAFRETATTAARHAPIPRPVAGAGHILFVGRLARQKDLPTLLAAFSQLSDRIREPMHLTLAGDGPLREELEEHARGLGIAHRVHFTGFVREPLRYMADADVFVLPSVQEAFGYVLVEALGVGLPVVSTDCPWGPAYILEDGRWGRLVPVGDTAAMTAAIEATLAAPPAPGSLLERARAFDSPAVARRYGHLFRSLLAGGWSSSSAR